VTRVPNQYPTDWPAISLATREAAGWRCVRCRHPFSPAGAPLRCDTLCDERRGRTWRPFDGAQEFTAHNWQKPGLNYGVHHLDGDKANGAWWNLLALCNSCHLTVQSRVIVERPYILAHSEWFVPYVCGWYAHYYGQLSVTREEVLADPARFLAMGQPHLHEVLA
jgi:5-methylcytosine-specific restriction endonuclease McrA